MATINQSFNKYRNSDNEICSQDFAERNHLLPRDEYLKLYDQEAAASGKLTIMRNALSWDKQDKNFTMAQKIDFLAELYYTRSREGYYRECRFKQYFLDEFGVEVTKTAKEYDRKYGVDYFNHEHNTYLQVKPISNYYWKKKEGNIDYEAKKIERFEKKYNRKVDTIYETNDGEWIWEKEMNNK